MNPEKGSNVFIASSWKQRERVRALADALRQIGVSVYDFTDPRCRKTPEIPPEKYPEQFDPTKHNYWEYIGKSEWLAVIEENFENIDRCNILVLLLPCGIDAIADWAYAVAKGKETYIVGHPHAGERSPVHRKANGWFADEKGFVAFLQSRYIIHVPQL